MLIIIIFLSIFNIIIGKIFESKFKKYYKIYLSSDFSGLEIILKMLRKSRIYNIKIIFSNKHLSDHYNPIKKNINLSKRVYFGKNISSIAVSTHECSHALQYDEKFFLLKFKHFLILIISPIIESISFLIIFGIFMINITIIFLKISIFLFFIIILFSFIILFIELDASNKALNWIIFENITNKDEILIVKDMLFLAFLTYLIEFLCFLFQFFYLVYVLKMLIDIKIF